MKNQSFTSIFILLF